MPTTTNYGWTTPADTDLVKDGASAIRTLGSSIDSTLKTQIDAQIPDALLTTKGDLIAATGASTPARLAVGTNGQVLTADSTSASGVAWATAAAGGMTLLSTTTLSGATTNISSISQGYKNLVLFITNVNLSAASAIRLIPISTSNIAYYNSMASSATTIGQNTVTDARVNGALNTVQLTNTVNSFYFTIYNYASTSAYKAYTSNAFFTDSNGTKQSLFVSGGWDTTSAISSLQFATSAGTYSAGTVLTYGVS